MGVIVVGATVVGGRDVGATVVGGDVLPSSNHSVSLVSLCSVSLVSNHSQSANLDS